MLKSQGRAKVFSSEEDASSALLAGELVKGDVVIIRYMGPKGDPGMRLLQRFLWLLAGKKMQESIAFVTDGRFSGTNKGCAIGHVTPEAADGGPIAVIQDGDVIEWDIPNQTISLKVTPETLQTRLNSWRRPEKKTKGFLSVYARLARPTDQGAALDYTDQNSGT
jgi:dihydroxy-acid dehydratase